MWQSSATKSLYSMWQMLATTMQGLRILWALQYCWTHVICCCYGRCFKPVFYGIVWLLGRCYCLIAISCNIVLFGWCYSLVALVQKGGDVLPPGWCYCLFIDVIIMIVVDGITTLLTVALESVPLVFALFWLMLLPRWLMLLPCGWCYCHYCLFV